MGKAAETNRGGYKKNQEGKVETRDRISAIDKKLKKIASFEIKVTDCVNRMADREFSMAVIAEKLDDLENRSRRSNLIVYGVNAQEYESPGKLETAAVKEVVNDVMRVSISGVERIHHLGTTKQSDGLQPMTVILKLVDYRYKANTSKTAPDCKAAQLQSVKTFLSRSVKFKGS